MNRFQFNTTLSTRASCCKAGLNTYYLCAIRMGVVSFARISLGCGRHVLPHLVYPPWWKKKMLLLLLLASETTFPGEKNDIFRLPGYQWWKSVRRGKSLHSRVGWVHVRGQWWEKNTPDTRRNQPQCLFNFGDLTNLLHFAKAIAVWYIVMQSVSTTSPTWRKCAYKPYPRAKWHCSQPKWPWTWSFPERFSNEERCAQPCQIGHRSPDDDQCGSWLGERVYRAVFSCAVLAEVVTL